MSECLEETTEFLEKSVSADYKEFEQVSEQYKDDVFSTMPEVFSAISERPQRIHPPYR